MHRLNHIAVTGLLLSTTLGTALAASVTVGPQDNIQAAVNQAAPGDTITVTPGTYTQKVVFSAKSGSANGGFITLKGQSGAILSGSGLATTGREGLITIRNSSYVRVEGFDINGLSASGSKTPVGILIEGSGSHLQIVKNKIHDIRNTSTCFGDDGNNENCAVGAHGLAVFGSNKTGITDLLIDSNEVYNNVLQSSESLVLNGNIDGFVVTNNNVHDNNNIGFDFIGYEDDACPGCGELNRARNGLVRNNVAKNNSSVGNPWYGNAGSAGGFYVDGGRYIVFDRNISTGNDIGFEFASEHGGKATEDIVMTDNFVYNNREAGLSVGGYDADEGESRRIYVNNNSFYKNRSNSKGWGTEVFFQYNVKNSSFANNIFYGVGTLADNYMTDGSGYSGNVWGVNLWHGTTVTASALPGTVAKGDPRYVAPEKGDLRLQATSPALNKGDRGTSLTNWTSPFWRTVFPDGTIPANGATDFDGQARFEGIIDLGADEFGTQPAAAR